MITQDHGIKGMVPHYPFVHEIVKKHTCTEYFMLFLASKTAFLYLFHTIKVNIHSYSLIKVRVWGDGWVSKISCTYHWDGTWSKKSIFFSRDKCTTPKTWQE